MTVELAIVGGLSFCCFLLAYYSINLRSKGEETGLGDKLSIFFFIMSFLFLNLLTYTLLLIAQNGGLTYLEEPVLNIGLQIMTYGTVGLLILFFIYTVIGMVSGIFDWYQEIMGKKRGGA